MRRVIGWTIFVLGFPIGGAAMTIGKELIGTVIVGIFIGALMIIGGWALAHPKKQ